MRGFWSYEMTPTELPLFLKQLIINTMAGGQRRFWNWKDDDLTIDISQWLIGLIDTGRYRGYDADLDATMTLKLNHEQTGAIRVDKDANWTDKFGVLSTKQGIIVQEYDVIELVVKPTEANQHRIDLVVLNHQYTEVVGGEQALYSIIEGVTVSDTQQAVLPLLPNEELQTIIGSLYLPPNTSGLTDTGVIYTPSNTPNFANQVAFIEKSDGFFLTDLSATGNKVVNLAYPTNPQDAATKNYVDQAILNNVVWATENSRGIAELLSSADVVTAMTTATADHSKIMTIRRWLQAYHHKIAPQFIANGNTESNQFITPKTLSNRFATETRKGVARIATDQEAIDGVDDTTIMTPYKVKKAIPLIPVTIEIGGWDIVSNLVKTLNHGLGADWDKVVGHNLLIISDDQSSRYAPNTYSIKTQTSSVTLTLVDTDAAEVFSSASNNRGFITFWLKKDLPPIANILNVNAGADNTNIGDFNEGTQMSLQYNLSGFIEAIGSPLDFSLWTVLTKPSDSNVAFGNASQVNATASVSHYGTYVFRLEATNDDGDTAQDTVTMIVEEHTNVPPIIQQILQSLYTTLDTGWVHPDGLLALGGWQTTSIQISATDADGDTLTYEVIEVESIDLLTGAIGPERANSILEYDYSGTGNVQIHGMARWNNYGGTVGVGDGVGFYFFKVIVRDGNGGEAIGSFRIKTWEWLWIDDDPIVTTNFNMSVTGNNTDSNTFTGNLLLNPVSDVATMTATILSPDNQAGNFDVYCNIGSGSGQFLGLGTHSVNPSIFASSMPFSFYLLSSLTGGATLQFRAYDSSGVLLDQHTILLGQ